MQNGQTNLDMKNLILSLAAILITGISFAQSPQVFNYQAVVRASDGEILQNGNVTFRFSILESSPAGNSVYVETHDATTNEFGLVNLTIGDGTIANGNFSQIDWANESHYLKVDLDPDGGTTFTEMSIQQLISVPYSIHAMTVSNSDNDTTNELQTISKNGSTITLSDGGGNVILADDDPDNEIQTISRNGNDAFLSNGGGSISVADDDNDAGNELQTISKNGINITLSSGGGTVSVADNDNDAANELQTISKSGTDITLSDGGGTISIADNDNDATNEIQTLSRSGSKISLSTGGGTVDINDADSSITNELQVLSKNGNMLTLSDNGGSFNIADQDSSITNELQVLSKNGNILTLSDNGGSFNIADQDSSITNELQVLSKNGNILTLSGNGGSFNVADQDSSIKNELQDLVVKNNILSLTQSTSSVPLNNISYWKADGDLLYATFPNYGLGKSTPNTDYALDLYSNDTLRYGISSNNVVRRSGTSINTQLTTTRDDTVKGYSYGLYNYLSYNPESGGSFATTGISNYILSSPDDASSQKTYGIYQDINRGDSGSGETVGNYLDLHHSGNDGLVTGNYEYVRATGDNQEMFYGDNREFHKTGSGFGNTMYGTKTFMTRSGSSSTTAPSLNNGNTIGDYMNIIYNPKSGPNHLYGSQKVIYSYPDDAATGSVYGNNTFIQRGDSGSGTTYGYYLDLNHSGNDGTVFGTFYNIDVDGVSADNAYGQYTNLSKNGLGTLYGNYNYVNRYNGYGRTYGLYNYLVYSPDSGSTAYEAHGMHTKVVSSPKVNIPVTGSYIEMTRGGSGASATNGTYHDISHTGSSGSVYGTYSNIVKTSTSSNAYSAGSRIMLEAHSGSNWGVLSEVSVGTNSSNASGSSTGGEFTASRYGTGDNGSTGLIGSGICNTTGSGYRVAIGVYGYAYQNSANGSSNAYGLYGYTLGNADVEYAAYMAGDVYSSGSYLPSDIKLKQNVETAGSSLERILGLRVYNYKYNDSMYRSMNLPKGHQTGFLAHEMQQSFPELTNETYQPPMTEDQREQMEKDGIEVPQSAIDGVEFTAVNYAGLVPHLTKAIQEQQVIIDEQKEQINTMNQRLTEMESVIKLLSETIDSK